MDFIHITDVHANKERLEVCTNALRQIRNYITEHSTSKKDAPPLLISGDFWDSTITNTENSGFTTYLSLMGELSEVTEIFMVSGTPSHEPKGSLDCFRAYGIHVFNETGVYAGDKYRIYAIPEPRKAEFSATSNKNLNEVILEDLRRSINFIKTDMSKHPYPINILMYHGDIKGSVLQNGMKVPETSYAMPPAWLKELNMDYIACGHIHMPQEVPGVPNCMYAGSIAPVNFGETHNAGFNLITIEEE